MITSRLCVSALLASSLLVACGNEPKTGIMPGIATGGYSAPTNADVSASYMGGFMARYDIPELDYPEDVKQSMKQTRLKRLDRDMEVAGYTGSVKYIYINFKKRILGHLISTVADSSTNTRELRFEAERIL